MRSGVESTGAAGAAAPSALVAGGSTRAEVLGGSEKHLSRGYDNTAKQKEII